MNGLFRRLAGTLSPAVALPVLIVALWTPACAVAQDNPEPPAALVVVIEEEISTNTVALVNRAVREVIDVGARYLILRISSPGGRLDNMKTVRDRLRALKRDDIATVAYVEDQAISAAALIAISCDQVFMKEGSEIGAITPIQYNPLTGQVQDIPDDPRRKLISSIQTMLHSAIEGTPRDNPTVRLILDAMVDPALELWSVTYKDESGLEDSSVVTRERYDAMQADANITFTFPNPVKLKQPLTLTPADAVRFGIAEGVVDSFDSVLEGRLNLDDSQVAGLAITWSENLATFLNDMRPVLFVLGFILLLIEFKTPGFALPGILGVIMFGLAFFGAYTVGLASIGEILLFFLGIGLLAMEIFMFPGTIIFGVAGFLSIVAGLILAQQSFVIPSDAAEKELMLANFTNFGLILSVVMIATWLVYTNIHRIPILKSAVQMAPPPRDRGQGTGDAFHAKLAGLLGVTGELSSDLRPTGWMNVGDERYDVVSMGSFIDKGSRVRVVEVRGNRVVVEQVEGDEPTGGEGGGEGGEVHLGVLFLLVLIGLALIVAEVFFVSFGVLAILSGVSLVSAVFLAFAHHGTVLGYGFLGFCAIGVPVTIRFAFRWLPHTPFGKHFYLDAPDPEVVTAGAAEEGLESYLGKSGVAICDLRPAGFARIDGHRVDVVTRGEMLSKDTPLRVIKVESNQVFVASDGRESIPSN